MEEDRTVGAEGISTSSGRGAGHDRHGQLAQMDNGIVVNIHIFTVCTPAFQNFQLTLRILSMFSTFTDFGYSYSWSFAEG